ncbi:hypothetical protein IAG41_20350 [Sphingomonas sp. JC676]|uniref:hypothetical protein n=1 Tax=Sphingomonas sp. JC676 TaxID=2768065 RepID=UPI001657FDEC|nr:hypothetical protein [Sphingomonas sp. JC676]MBC9034748.1 hypothetical protein [Sphingomonas sp. JC676]
MRGKLIAVATLVAGTLDIAAAIGMTLLRGKSVPRMLQGIASGPFGEWPLASGWAGAATGLAVHVAIMAAMVAAFVAVTNLLPWLRGPRLLIGGVYGALLYGIMYWIVLPLRFPPAPGSGAVTLASVLTPLGIHILLVGIPIALIAMPARGGNGGK